LPTELAQQRIEVWTKSQNLLKNSKTDSIRFRSYPRHCDLTPANILVSRAKGSPYSWHFGVSPFNIPEINGQKEEVEIDYVFTKNTLGIYFIFLSRRAI
jgi:hypothetical protein